MERKPDRQEHPPRRVTAFVPRAAGFTLVELLVAVSLTLIILVLLLQVIGFASSNWQRLSDNAKAFEGARAAFDSITRQLSQATLATEYDYYNAARAARLSITNTSDLTNFVPDTYGRYSSLHFISGKSLLPTNHTHALFFQMPGNFVTNSATAVIPASGLLNAMGYYIRYSDDSSDRPTNVAGAVPAPRSRYRLMQYMQPTENLDVYRDGSASSWFLADLDKSSHVLAENIVALVLLPKLPDEAGAAPEYLAPGYEYNSRTNWTTGSQPVQMHQLPPVVRVTMVAIDERSALRDPATGSTLKDLFKNPADFSTNLATAETALRNARANYKIFQTDVPLRAAKWSE